MKFLIVTLALVGSACAQSAYPAGALGSYGSSSLQTTTPKPNYPPAQVHYVNIGEDLAGDYKFGYDTGKSGAGQSFREESRLPDGTVKGAYGYVDAEGKQRIVKYTAGIEGFKVESDQEAPGQGSPSSAPAPAPVRTYTPPQPQVVRTYSPPPTATIQAAPAPQVTYQLPPSQSSSQPLGGYSPVPTTRYIPASSPSVSSLPQSAPTTTYRAPSPLPNYQAAISTQLSQANAAIRTATPTTSTLTSSYSPSSYSSSPSTSYSPSSYSPATYSQGSYSPSTLAQRQPTLTSVPARPATHLASIPRSASPSLAAQFNPSQFGASSLTQPQETTTWGPPVINKELLSYNIGIQG